MNHLFFYFKMQRWLGNTVVHFDVLMICPAFINGYPGYSNSISSIK